MTIVVQLLELEYLASGCLFSFLADSALGLKRRRDIPEEGGEDEEKEREIEMKYFLSLSLIQKRDGKVCARGS